MAYTRAWDETQPPGTALAASLDTIIQNFRTDIRERVAGIFGLNLAQFTADPVAPISLTLSGNLSANVVGNLTGNVTGNLTGSVLTASQPNITSVGTLISLAVGNITSTGDIAALTFKATSGGNVTIGPVSGQLRITRQGAESVGILGESNGFGNLIANQLTGTLQTAAQGNVTSLGTLTGLTVSSPILVDNYVNITRGGVGKAFFAAANAANQIVNGSAQDDLIVRSNGFNFRISTDSGGTSALVINAAGNAVFAGTVTAANFVGPTTLDANNLTGTTLNAGVIHSSLQDVGTLSFLRVNSGGGQTVQLRTSDTTGGYVSFTNQSGATFRGFVGNGSSVFASGAVTDFGIASEGGNLVFATTSGTVRATISASTGVLSSTAGFSGNLTGTILTAAQANITSLGTLTGLTINGAMIQQGALLARFENTGGGPGGTGTGIEIYRGGIQAYNRTTVAYAAMAIDALDIQVNANGGSGRLLVGTTSATGVAVGGIRAAGDSVFDGLITSNLTSSVIFTSTIAGTNPRIFRINNTSGATDFGTSGNVASSVFVNDTAYSSIFGSQGAKSLHLGTNGVVRFTIDSAGAVSALGAWTFNSTVGGITTLTATTLTGTLSTAAQGNITSVGILTGLAVASASGLNVTLNTTSGATSDNIGILFQRASTIKWRLATNVDGSNVDKFSIYSDVLGANVLSFTTAGAATFGYLVTGSAGFSGALTGNVTGNLTGTVLTAAQANITSLGTLTGLTLNGNLTLSAATTKFLVGATALAIKDSTDTTTIASFSNAGADFSISSLSIKISTITDNAGNQVLSTRRTGWGTPTATLSRTAVANADTLGTTISHLAALVQDLLNHGLIGA